jgi:hypothetical protein
VPEGGLATEIAWLEPDLALEGVADAAPGPEARYEMRKAVQFAFVKTIRSTARPRYACKRPEPRIRASILR